MEKSSSLPSYQEWLPSDASDLSALLTLPQADALRKMLDNRIAEHAQSLFNDRDLDYTIRIEEVYSILSELDGDSTSPVGVEDA